MRRLIRRLLTRRRSRIREMESTIQDQRDRINDLELESKLQKNQIKWLRWVAYRGTEPPGHRRVVGFEPSGRPIFDEAGTPFWGKK